MAAVLRSFIFSKKSFEPVQKTSVGKYSYAALQQVIIN